jgi:hypothetical protein
MITPHPIQLSVGSLSVIKGEELKDSPHAMTQNYPKQMYRTAVVIITAYTIVWYYFGFLVIS